MLSKNQAKYLQSLHMGKFRDEYKVFPAEGVKLVNELLLSHFIIIEIFGLKDWFEKNKELVQAKKTVFQEITSDELKKISNLVTPNEVLAVVQYPELKVPDSSDLGELTLYLDQIQGPGNLGTIIRTADWFGIRNIFCSPGTADVYNPKVVQATMGSICRVNIQYLEPEKLKQHLDPSWKIYGTLPGSENIYNSELLYPAVIVIGNESKGISESTKSLLTHAIGIPSFAEGAESLNASVATGIVISEFCRRKTKQ